MTVASVAQPVQSVPVVEQASPTVESVSISREAGGWLAAVPLGPELNRHPNGWYQRALQAEALSSDVNVIRLPISSMSAREREETHGFTRHTLAPSNADIHPFALPADRYTWAPPVWAVLVKADQHVVAHTGILYRVIQVDDVRVPVGGLSTVMTLHGWRGRGFARAVIAKATAFVAVWLWAPFAVVICPRAHTGFYEALGWRVAEAPIWCEQPGGRVNLQGEVAMFLECQGDATWPRGPIDLCGVPW